MNQIRGRSMLEAVLFALSRLDKYGEVVTTSSWQGTDKPPEFLEVLMLNMQAPMYKTEPDIYEHIAFQSPTWVKDHFAERVSGEPLNPPPSHAYWLKGTDQYLSGDKFSHSYPERLWPKNIHGNGIRFQIADLNDAVQLLKKDPTTRQCYVPIWFPEDGIAALDGERVPCTMGWHFIIRNNRLNIHYPMRATDAVRHFMNDVAFANLLGLWMIEQTGLQDVSIGDLCFTSSSFHCFENDRYALNQLMKKITG